MNTKATVLIVDGGGRGSVLVYKYARSPHVGKIIAVPGNDLMVELTPKPVQIFKDIKTTDLKEIIRICQQHHVDLIDIAQDDAIAQGLTDVLKKENFKVLGPTRAAGQIEWDKAWARNFMVDFNIPSPKFKVCFTEQEGIDFIKSQKESQWFIKASGLVAGKGALYARNNQEAQENITKMKTFGIKGQTYLIEKCLYGEEFSSFALVDGQDFQILGHAQDHKTVFNNNLGPNTGGMGCSSPPMAITNKIAEQIKIIFKKTLKGLALLKRPYRGILYLGGIIDKNGKVYVIEFNARWGDPEAQVVLPQIKNDFYEIAKATIEKKFSKIKLKRDKLYRIAVTAAASGYPIDSSQAQNKQIFGLEKIFKNKDIQIFGAGIRKIKKKYYVAGGRLLTIVAKAPNVALARQKAYNALSLIFIESNNLHYRTDIGYRDLERLYEGS
ncbi:phosphoribosylamine--glycine ligase [Candidatus Curtissbacteria bacterium]|nr:phosphoribosylamine--glycine ligase [Candidatus Curtissbacteria bacterium]